MNNRIKVIFHAYADYDNYNAQNLNAKEIAKRLNPEIFDIYIFYRNKLDPELEKDNIYPIKIPFNFPFLTTLFVVYKLLGNYDILFYLRKFNIDQIYLRLRKLFRDNKIVFYYLENVFDESERKDVILNNLKNCDYAYSVSNYVSLNLFENTNIYTNVIYVGVDREKFKPLTYWYREDIREFVILFVGSLTPRKRVYLMLQIAEHFKDCKIIIVGRGKGESYIYRAIKNRELDNVIFYDLKLRECDLIELYQTSHIHVLPSLIEGLPKVVLESQATGTPSIIFDTYGYECIDNCLTGYAVSSLKELFDKIEKIKNNRELWIYLSRNARAFTKDFDWNFIVAQWEIELINAYMEKMK